MKKFKEMKETHMQGRVSFENIDMLVKQYSTIGDLGIQIAKDSRVWICVNGIAAIRFTPDKKET